MPTVCRHRRRDRGTLMSKKDTTSPFLNRAGHQMEQADANQSVSSQFVMEKGAECISGQTTCAMF